MGKGTARWDEPPPTDQQSNDQQGAGPSPVNPNASVQNANGFCRKLGRNINGYLGETIEIERVLQDCLRVARPAGWELEELSAQPKPSLLALVRRASIKDSQRTRRIYISAGIHGDEPAGPLAVLELLRQDRWPAHAELYVCPCLNPTGFTLNRRENCDGTDLNRHYLEPTAAEIVAHVAWLRRQPRFDLCLCLHEDWEAHGFYLYELNPDEQPSLAERIIQAVQGVCPIDRSELIEGRPARGGIIRPSLDPRTRQQWPESFFLLTYKTRLSYTLEAPSDFPLEVRARALVAAVQAALGSVPG
jgi:murein peptide amidase A